MSVPYGTDYDDGDQWADEDGAVRDDQEWDEPVPLGEPEQPPFPVEHLGALRPIVDAVSEAHQVPADFAALHALGVVSAALGGNRAVQVLPDWTEEGGIYGVTAAASSERKSPPFALLTQPLRDAEQRKSDEGAAERADAADYYELVKSRYDDAKRKAGKAQADLSRGEVDDDLKRYREELVALVEPPAAPRLLASDITPEAIARIMHEQGGRLAILATEGGIFDTLAGRYSGTPNFDVLLNGYSGEPVTVDRQGAEPIRILAAHLVMLLCVQPHVLESIGRKQEAGFRGRGLLGRFLYSLPASMVGRRSLDPTPVPDNLRKAWDALVTDLVDHVWSGDRRVLPLDPDAAATLHAYRAEHEPRLAEGGGLDDLPDWAGKLPGHLVRIALALTLADNPQASAVTGTAMRNAVAMSPYFEAHARHAYQLMTSGRDDQLHPARSVLKWIRRTGKTEFSTRDAWQAIRGQAWAQNTEAVADALDVLADHGWIDRQESDDNARPGRGRRKSPQWDVSPYAHRSGHTQKPHNHRRNRMGSDSGDFGDTASTGRAGRPRDSGDFGDTDRDAA